MGIIKLLSAVRREINIEWKPWLKMPVWQESGDEKWAKSVKLTQWYRRDWTPINKERLTDFVRALDIELKGPLPSMQITVAFRTKRIHISADVIAKVFRLRNKTVLNGEAVNELKWTEDLAEIVEVKNKGKFGYLVSHTPGAYPARLNALNESLSFKKKLTYVGTQLLARVKTTQTRALQYNWADILFHKLREELEAILSTRACISYAGPVLDAILSCIGLLRKKQGRVKRNSSLGWDQGRSTSPPPTKTLEAKGNEIIEKSLNDVSATEIEAIRLADEADIIAEQKEFYEERMRAQVQQVEVGTSKMTSPTAVTQSKSGTSLVVTPVVTTSPKEPLLTSYFGKGSRKGQAVAKEGVTITPRHEELPTVTQEDQPSVEIRLTPKRKVSSVIRGDQLLQVLGGEALSPESEDEVPIRYLRPGRTVTTDRQPDCQQALVVYKGKPQREDAQPVRQEPVKRRPRLTESGFGNKTNLHCQGTDTRIPTCSEERIQHNSLYEHLCLIEEARASIKATSTYDAVLQKTREVLTTIHEDNVRLLGENDNLRLATENLAL